MTRALWMVMGLAACGGKVGTTPTGADSGVVTDTGGDDHTDTGLVTDDTGAVDDTGPVDDTGVVDDTGPVDDTGSVDDTGGGDDTGLEGDADGDGYVDVDLGGDDCDDTDATVYPGASESNADGIDNDCDGDIDEDAYCNRYAPLSNGSAASKTISGSLADGTVYVETFGIGSWDAASGTATLDRFFVSSSGNTYDIYQDITCNGDGVVTNGWILSMSGSPIMTVNYDYPRQDLLPEPDMLSGQTWQAEYLATDPSSGDLWTVQADYEVVGTDTITVSAGTFDVLAVKADYSLVDLMMSTYDREGTITWYYAAGLGEVYAEDLLTDGSTWETRELTAYSGFYP